MGNDDIIRPPKLATPIASTSGTQSNQNVSSVNELEMLIGSIVQSTLQRQGKEMINSILNPNADNLNFTDQVIDAQHQNNLNDLDRIPDIVRSLKDFTGEPGQFSSWRKSVDRILQIYDPIRGTPKYYGIISVIRNKIVGPADAVLESYNTPLNWPCITRCLTLHYADKRDLGTLEYQMTSLVQGNLSIQEFYQSVYMHLSLILNKISGMEIGNDSLNLLMQTYRDKALDTFVRGLKGDLPRLLGIREPVDLPQALHLCLKLENQNFRTHYAISNQTTSRKFSHPPPIPPRRHNLNNNYNPQQHKLVPFYPQLAHTPPPTNFYQKPNQYKQHPFGYNHNYQQQNRLVSPQRPFMPKPQQKPEPMDIDHSVQTKAVNYMNRPQQNQFNGKRPPPNSAQFNPNKYQRNFHINSNNSDQYEQPPPQHPEHHEYLENTIEAQQYFATESQHLMSDNIETDDGIDFSDIHFLE